MKRKLFVVTKYGPGPDEVDVSYEPSLYNFLMNQHLKRTGGVPDDLPIGEWFATFKWRRSIFPGILFREL